MRKGKITVRRELRQPDEFVKFSSRALAYVKQHPWHMAAVAGLFAVVFVGVTGGRAYIDHRGRQAALLLTDMVSAAPAEAGNGGWERVLPPAAELRERFGSTAPAALGAYVEGVARLRLKQYADARHAFTLAMDTGDAFLSGLSRVGMATASFEEGAWEDVITILEPLHGGTVAGADAWLLTGLSRARLGRQAEARQAFEQVLRAAERAPYHDWVAEEVERLRLQEKRRG
ncbi:MAG: tetratricopeptide repeat protein [Deltaproteobacteria bacterium]|nr:tetratricopeptide repeat protein [Candidatus Anaeroferrophillacea bacterium]